MSLVQLIKDSPEERKKAWFTIEADAISFFEHCHSWFAEGVNAGKVEIKREFRSLIMDE